MVIDCYIWWAGGVERARNGTTQVGMPCVDDGVDDGDRDIATKSKLMRRGQAQLARSVLRNGHLGAPIASLQGGLPRNWQLQRAKLVGPGVQVTMVGLGGADARIALQCGKRPLLRASLPNVHELGAR